jgi:hypothetical protein
MAEGTDQNIAYSGDSLAVTFPGSATYQHWRHGQPHQLAEASVRRRAFPYSERHLHCVWHDPALRPPNLRTRTGEAVIVEHPGRWNQEAGPDFLGAVLRIGPAARRIAGDVEMHVHPADWRAHGHANDPRYAHVRFHVTYFPGADDDIDLVPGAEHIVLKDPLTCQPGFSFDHIDPTAYPYAARAEVPPCSRILQHYSPAQRQMVLQAAGEERLRRKAERLVMLIHERGEEQTLYEEIMAALGYKHNKAAFRQVAVSLPLEELRRASRGEPRTAYALLMGVARLLPEQPKADWSDETKAWLRALWDQWWRCRDRFERRGPAPAWRLDGIRPANHPSRRLMAAAHLFCATPGLNKRVQQLIRHQPDRWIPDCCAYLQNLHDPYMSMRLSLTGTARKQPVALLGPARARAILTNVLVPFLAASGKMNAVVRQAIDRLPVEADNGIIKQTAYYLFGRDHSPELYASALARQGLIQIFHDFCVNDRTRCAACTLPQALKAHLSSPEGIEA